MRKRIKQLLTVVPLQASANAAELSASTTMTAELVQAILDDLDSGRTHTYEQIAHKLGCSAENVRMEAKKEPGVLRISKPHRVPDVVFRRMVRRLVSQ